MALLEPALVSSYEGLVKESYPLVRDSQPAQLDTLINNALSLGEWELARIACRALFALQPQVVLQKLRKLAFEGAPPGWFASAGLPTSFHLAWLAAGEYEELCRRKVRSIVRASHSVSGLGARSASPPSAAAEWSALSSSPPLSL